MTGRVLRVALALVLGLAVLALPATARGLDLAPIASLMPACPPATSPKS